MFPTGSEEGIVDHCRAVRIWSRRLVDQASCVGRDDDNIRQIERQTGRQTDSSVGYSMETPPLHH